MNRLLIIARNIVSILSSDVLNRMSTLVVYALIARYLGTYEFGQMSLALTLFYLFQVLATAGLRTHLAREVAKNRENTDIYLLHGGVVVLLSGLLSMAVLAVFVAMIGYAPDTAAVIRLFSLILLPFCLSSIVEGVFQGWERIHFIAYANVPVNLIKVVLAFVLLSQGGRLTTVVLLLLLAQVAVLLIEVWLALQYIAKPARKFDLHFSLLMLQKASTFLGIDVTIALWTSLNILLLSRLENEADVGLFNAATQLTVPVVLFYQSITFSIFPVMCQRFNSGVTSLGMISKQLVMLLLSIAFPATIGLIFLADQALLFLYHDPSFLAAAPALRITAWALIFIALTFALGQTLWAGQQERVSLRIATFNMLVSLILGYLLIRQFGLIGAAITTVLGRMFGFLQHYYSVSRLVFKIPLLRLAWRPGLAAAGMAIYLALIHGRGLPTSMLSVSMVVLSAALVYAGLLLIFTFWSVGGARQLKERYVNPWLE